MIECVVLHPWWRTCQFGVEAWMEHRLGTSHHPHLQLHLSAAVHLGFIDSAYTQVNILLRVDVSSNLSTPFGIDIIWARKTRKKYWRRTRFQPCLSKCLGRPDFSPLDAIMLFTAHLSLSVATDSVQTRFCLKPFKMMDGKLSDPTTRATSGWLLVVSASPSPSLELSVESSAAR